MGVPTMNPLFMQAIAQKRRLRFMYHGTPRLVEPQCDGIGHKGTELRGARQLREAGTVCGYPRTPAAPRISPLRCRPAWPERLESDDCSPKTK